MTCDLAYGFNFLYKAVFDDGLTEHELDHVFFGKSNDKPVINNEEVEDFKYIKLEDLKNDIDINPTAYTPWLKICLDKVISHISTDVK